MEKCVKREPNHYDAKFSENQETKLKKQDLKGCISWYAETKLLLNDANADIPRKSM